MGKAKVGSWLAVLLAVMGAAGPVGSGWAAEADSLGVILAAPQVAAPAPAPALEREVADLRAAFRERLAGLTEVYAAAVDAESAATAQAEITVLKLQLEADLLGIQLRLARERNDADAVAELSLGLDAIAARLAADTGRGSASPTPAAEAAN